jgi:23S rRNA G2069 N7-methylase RlmK/C1962 C5-methylase RlmI
MAKTMAIEEGRRIKPHTILRQAADHPVLPAFPESQYLSGFLLEIL